MSRRFGSNIEMATVYEQGYGAVNVQHPNHKHGVRCILVKLSSPADAVRYAGYLNKPGAFVAVVYQQHRRYDNDAAFHTGQSEHIKSGLLTLREVYVDYAKLDMRIGIAVPVS